MQKFPKPILVFSLFIRILIKIMALFVTNKAFYLAPVFVALLFVLFDQTDIEPCSQNTGKFALFLTLM